MKTWEGKGNIEKGKGGSTGLGCGEGMLVLGEPKASLEELESCFR